MPDSISGVIDERFEHVLKMMSNDPQSLFDKDGKSICPYDFRADNGRPDNKYTLFWEELHKFLAEYERVDERRHGLPIATIVKDLIAQVVSRLPEHRIPADVVGN